MEIIQQLGLIAIILLYGIVLARRIPAAWHFAANAVAAVAAVAYGLWAGLNYAAMGLSLHFIKDGIIIALVATLLIMVGVAIITRIPPARRFFELQQIMEPGRVAYETVVRIPLSTALTEEVLFRGVLLGLLMSYHGAVLGAIYSSLVFGVWHILPSQQGLKDRHGDNPPLRPAANTAYMSLNVAATAVAGVLFCWLRVLAGSIIAPWLVHWTINSSALLAAHTVTRQKTDT